MAKGREPLRIPQQWKTQDRQFVIQLERILDDVYGGKADAEETKKAIAELTQSVADLDDDKLDKVNVYNGLDKTDSGFALDARQGPVLSGIFDKVQDAIAIIADGDTHVAISSGEYVYVKNNTHGLTDGLYKANANVAANGAISSSNMTADSKGGLNALNSNLTSISDHIGTLEDDFLYPKSYTTCAAMFSAAPDNSFIIGYTAIGASDNPSSTGNWVIQQRKVNSNYGFQFAMQSNTNDIYFRRIHGGTTYSWVKISAS